MRTSYKSLLGMLLSLTVFGACRGSSSGPNDLELPDGGGDSSLFGDDSKPLPTLPDGGSIDGLYDSGGVDRCVPPKELDVLFLIDNSTSMASKQKALSATIGTFITKIDQMTAKYGINYHVGVATSDTGGPMSMACSKMGDDGVLQNTSCRSRGSAQSADFKNACEELCPTSVEIVPKNGARFISKTYTKDAQNNVIGSETNVPNDKVEQAFKCIALVGDIGCALESQFEGAKRALDGHRSENAGFLSADPSSVLAVIFITDEDDCSVRADQRSLNDTTEIKECTGVAPNATDDYKCFNANYRCFGWSNTCDQLLTTTGNKTNCQPKPDNFLDPVKKYVEFFKGTRQPDRLVVAGVWTLPAVQAGGPAVTVSYMSGGTSSSFLQLNTSCDDKKGVVGYPQLRLSQLAKEFIPNDLDGKPLPNEFAICDVSKYSNALDSIATALAPKLGCKVR